MAGRRTKRQRQADDRDAMEREARRRASGLPVCPEGSASVAEKSVYLARMLELNYPPGEVLLLARNVWRASPAAAESLLAGAGQYWLESRNLLDPAQREAILDAQLQRVARNCEQAGDTYGQISAMRERRALLVEAKKEIVEVDSQVARDSADELEKILADLVAAKPSAV